jgi:hypothetical protein
VLDPEGEKVGEEKAARDRDGRDVHPNPLGSAEVSSRLVANFWSLISAIRICYAGPLPLRLSSTTF